jgi:UDP-N-acetylmuramate-alanine ligase
LENHGISAHLKNIFEFIFTGKKLDYELVKKYTFFVEACEYQRHFLTLDLDYAIITNITLDHTDYFKDFADYASAFETLVSKVKQQVFTFGNLLDEAILQDPKAVIVEKQHFDFQYIRGDHQQQNASLVFALLDELTKGEKSEEIKTGITQFRGIRRRMELLTTTEQGTMIFSDYGHVAESLEVGFQALKEKFSEKKLICIFQPHQMHRILQGRNDFPEAMKGYDQRYIYNIYAARENFNKIAEDFGGFQKISASYGTPKNVEELGVAFAKHTDSTYLKTFEEVENIIKKAEDNEIIIVYSAGDIDYDLRKWLAR